jgi:hypothetical protein
METLLMNYVNHHQRTCRGCEQPQRCDDYRSNYGSRGSDFFFPPYGGGLCKLAAFLEHVRWCDPVKQFCSQVQNEHVIHKADHGNEAWDELNRTEQVARGTGCH